MAGPTVIVDIDKIEDNARTITGMCRDYGISVTAVSKVTCGMPQVARALLRGGAEGIGESRLENVHRLRANGIVADMMLLRIPPLSGTEEIVRSVDISLNSELSVIRGLSEAALEHGIIHKILMMIDLGDLREGFWPDDVIPAAREIAGLPNIKLQGVGTNLTCYGGVIPTRENIQSLIDWAHRIEDVTGLKMETISGGNTSSLPLLASGKMPKEVNHLRIGEGILLGRETIQRTAWQGTSQEAFRLKAEVIELKEKPSVPIGETGQDAFGHTPVFEDKGEMRRAILNVGREDVDVDGLTPKDPRMSILGASSDHLLVDVTSLGPELEIGSTIEFYPNYGALLAAMTSAYVEKYTVSRKEKREAGTSLTFFGSSFSEDPDSAFMRTLVEIGYSVDTKAVAFHNADSFERHLSAYLQEEGFPLLCGKKRLTVHGYRSFSKAVDGAGMIWISPYASLTDTYSGNHDLGILLAGDKETAPGSENLVMVGVREADRQEAETIRTLGIPVYTMEDIDQIGIQAVMRKALQRAVIGTQGLYVYFDQRICDGGQEGLTARETHLMLELLARTGFMRVLDVSGVHVNSREKRALQHFVSSALGKRILG